jgi:phosphodiesterase/alkaline phosphatase D-like protein
VLGYATATSQALWIQCDQACQTNHFGSVQDWTDEARVTYHDATDDTVNIVCALASAKRASKQPCNIKIVSQRTVVVTLKFLQPCTKYAYELSGATAAIANATARFDAQGSFQTWSTNSESGCRSQVLSTSTDQLASSAFTFAFGSCLGISPFSDIRAFSWLAQRAEPTDLVLLLGDTIYTDIPALTDSFNTTSELAYKQIWSDAAFSSLFRSIPFYGTYDDHEIVNDWSLSDDHSMWITAMRFFDEYVGSKNPPPPVWTLRKPPPVDPEDHPRVRLTDKDKEGTAIMRTQEEQESFQKIISKRRYYSFQRGKHTSVFVLDTRQYASPVLRGDEATELNELSSNRTKLGAEQLSHLLAWLKSTPTTFKFIASSVAWTGCAFKFVQDGWRAYRYERNLIFDFIVENNITGVILLSADLHWSGLFHLKEWNLYELTVSPIQSFPLPHWISTVEGEIPVMTSKMWMHLGEVKVFDPEIQANTSSSNVHTDTPMEPFVELNIYRYMYGTPELTYTKNWTKSDLVHRDVREITSK